MSPGKRELINASLANPVDHESIGLWDFVMHEELGLPALIEYLNRWERNAAAHPHSLVVRYEELRLQTAKTLAAVTSFIGESFTDAEIQEAVDFGSFDNMRQLETSGFFRHGGYSRRKHVDGQSTFKVRRGQVFGYRDDLDAEQLAQVDAMVESRLSPSLGYARGGPAEELAAAASAENA